MTGSDTASWEAHRKRVTGGILRSSAFISDAIFVCWKDFEGVVRKGECPAPYICTNSARVLPIHMLKPI